MSLRQAALRKFWMDFVVIVAVGSDDDVALRLEVDRPFMELARTVFDGFDGHEAHLIVNRLKDTNRKRIAINCDNIFVVVVAFFVVALDIE